MFGSKKTPDEKAAAKRATDLKVAAGVLGIRVVDDGATFRLMGQDDVPVAGASVTVDHGEAAKRITMARVALAGPFALAMKKDATRLFITIEGADGSAMLREVGAKADGKARSFATMVNSRAAQ